MSEMILNNISMDLIDPNPNNNRIFTLDKIDHLASIIKEEGFTTPIEVVKKPDGRYEILSGHRRFAAMKSLGRTEIPCYIAGEYDETTETDKTKRLLSSNIAQRRLTPLEIANAISFYRDVLKKEKYKGGKREKIAEFFGITPSNVYRYECLLNLIPELQELCKRPNFPYSSLRQASTLTPIDQKELYDELMRLESIKTDQLSTSEEIDDDDKSEIIFSRTRIETIINSKIRNIERETQKKEEMVNTIQDKKVNKVTDKDNENKDTEVKEQNSSEDFMPLPDSETTLDEDTAIQEYISEDSNNVEDSVILKMDDIINESVENSTFFNGLDMCIATVNAYRKNATLSIHNGAEVRNKIKELRDALNRLEEIL